MIRYKTSPKDIASNAPSVTYDKIQCGKSWLKFTFRPAMAIFTVENSVKKDESSVIFITAFWAYEKENVICNYPFQFNLYCDKDIYAYLSTSIFFVGWAIGAVPLGIASDRLVKLIFRVSIDHFVLMSSPVFSRCFCNIISGCNDAVQFLRFWVPRNLECR